jgi:hypothetical protein
MQVLWAMNKLTLLLESQSQSTLTLQMPPSKQLALGNSFYSIYWLAKNTKNIKIFNIG